MIFEQPIADFRRLTATVRHVNDHVAEKPKLCELMHDYLINAGTVEPEYLGKPPVFTSTGKLAKYTERHCHKVSKQSKAKARHPAFEVSFTGQ
jgi:hypothetical protein